MASRFLREDFVHKADGQESLGAHENISTLSGGGEARGKASAEEAIETEAAS